MGPKLPWDADLAQAIIDKYSDVPGASLPILHALQDEFGYVDPAAVPLIAKALHLSRAEIHGVISFYHEFRTEPSGHRIVKLCRAEACQSMGCRELAGHAPGLAAHRRERWAGRTLSHVAILAPPQRGRQNGSADFRGSK